MSPSTLELFESLGGVLPSITDITELDGKTNDYNAQEVEATVTTELDQKNTDEPKNNKDQETDFSGDTDSNYVPDSGEISDSSDDLAHPITKKKVKTGMETISLPNVDNDTTNDSTSILNPVEPSRETQEKVVVDSNLINNVTEEATVSNSEPFNNASGHLESQTDPEKGRPKKGRKRKYPEHSLAQRKERKYANLPYQGKNKRVSSKVFRDYVCPCKRQCFTLVSQEKRKIEFDKFVTLGSYKAQLLYIINNVKESPKARAYTVLSGNKSGKNRKRTYRRKYYISDIEVCKDMFVNNFQISTKRIDVCLLKQRSDSFEDKRGKKQGGWNKTPEDHIQFIRKVINLLPKYESHYRRGSNSDCQYLKMGMTVQKVYEIYTEELKKTHGSSKKPVSFETLKRIFYDDFNLRCKSLKKDTCNKCDTFAQRIQNCKADEKEKLIEEKEKHLKIATDLRNKMNSDLKRAKNDKYFECLTYDLEKTLPLPRIPTNIVFYKRQLWLYNSGIHVGSDDSGHCNVWVEGEAGRGAQEVGSCLVRFIRDNLNDEVKNLVLWSDCCGGQNRNIKIVLMLKALLNSHPSLETITLKYLESGHTFLPNDTDFSKIEYQLKYHQCNYTPEEYISVMNCQKKRIL